MPLDFSRNESKNRSLRTGFDPENSENPYAITNDFESIAITNPVEEVTPASIATTILLWTVVCSLSAAPSFFFAIAELARYQAAAMIVGVCIFIGIYSAADLLSRKLPFRKNPRIRSILRATFIVRSIMVVIFPVALVTDMFLGMFSVGLVRSVTRPLTTDYFKDEMGFGMTLATTLVQGCMLSIFLFFLGLLISAIVFVVRAIASRLS